MYYLFSYPLNVSIYGLFQLFFLYLSSLLVTCLFSFFFLFTRLFKFICTVITQYYYRVYAKLWLQWWIIIHFEYYITLFTIAGKIFITLLNMSIVHYGLIISKFNLAMFIKILFIACNIEPMEMIYTYIGTAW